LVLLAAKAVVFNMVSLAAAYGVLTWVWQDGHGSTALFGRANWWLPGRLARPLRVPVSSR
jgi:hypothetical protein